MIRLEKWDLLSPVAFEQENEKTAQRLLVPTFPLNPPINVCQIAPMRKVRAIAPLLVRERNESVSDAKQSEETDVRLSRRILSAQYNVNFLWVNLNPQRRGSDIAENIFGKGENRAENDSCIQDPHQLRSMEQRGSLVNAASGVDEAEQMRWKAIQSSYAFRIAKWADANPGVKMILWTDSALITQRAWQNTFAVMASIGRSRGVDLQLRDIRQIPNMPSEIVHSFHPAMPLYYRVDMLKVVIMDYMIRSPDGADYCVMSDFDVEPMNAAQLFDQQTIDYLSSWGYVFNGIGNEGFENSFFIFNKHHIKSVDTHYIEMIQKTNAVIHALREITDWNVPREMKMSSEFVYNQYRFFRYEMNERGKNPAPRPRKVVKCPMSQFQASNPFTPDDHRAETARFRGDNNVPYTENGRAFNGDSRAPERIIPVLERWKAEPLVLTQAP